MPNISGENCQPQRPKLCTQHIDPRNLPQSSLMICTTDPTKRIRILQLNLNKSESAHLELINRNLGRNWDVICIQEPYITRLGHIRTPNRFRPVHPSSRYDEKIGKVRSVMWINDRLDTNGWEIVNVPKTNDITAIKIRGDSGKLAIFNVYNACDHNKTQDRLNRFLCDHQEEFYRDGGKNVLWCGDFNRHHALWDREEDTDLFRGQNGERADKFIEVLAEHDMVMALPRGIPTIQTHRTKRFTRPDNVFVTEQLLTSIVICDVDALWRPPCTDHFPITTILDITADKAKPETKFNFRAGDWKKFRKELEKRLPELREPDLLDSVNELNEQIECLTRILQETMEATIPKVKECPFMKRWWNKELEEMKKMLNKMNKQSYQWTLTPQHPSFIEYKNLRSKYADTIITAKKTHWEEFLEEATDREMWMANKYLKDPVGDGGKARIPTLSTKDDGGVIRKHTTNEEKATALGDTFFPKKPANSTTPENYLYQEPLPPRTKVNEDQVLHAIHGLAPHKAPGPDGIPNVVLQESAPLIVSYLVGIFQASLNLGHQYPGWKSFTTAVIRKPGKPSYEAPKAYRPIALLCTLGKVLTAIVTEEISCILENERLLPSKHFGGRPCRTTTDAVHYLVDKIKGAWRRDLVVSVLYLDVEGAFPNAVTERLIHNMRKRRVPNVYVNFVRSLLEGRQTNLRFDDYVSDPIPIDNGIGQGDPLSMLIYLIYNADLLQVPDKQEEDALGYVDDACFIAIGKTFKDTTNTLQDMMERKEGGFDWGKAHNSKFALDKLAITHFLRGKRQTRDKERNGGKLTLILEGKEVKEVEVYKYLGVSIDKELKWKVQEEKAIAKATEWVLMFKRLAKPAMGINQKLMRKLYLGVAIPKMTYALDVWYEPPILKEGAKKRTGSVRALSRLQKIQRIAALAITGGLRSTPNDLLDAHAGLTPLHLMLDKICHRNLLRVCTLPDTNPLSYITKNGAARQDKKHLTNLQVLLNRYSLDPRNIETIRPPVFTSADPQPAKLEIADSRIDSMESEKADTNTIKVYSDGSGLEGKIGAAAVLVDESGRIPTKILQFYLGTAKEHTTYEAEAVGAILAMKMIKDVTNEAKRKGERIPAISHYTDSQSVIKALRSRKSKPGQYLIDSYRRGARDVGQANDTNLELRWISAHSGVDRNELVDVAAKEAAAGRSDVGGDLPAIIRKGMKISKSALRQAKAAEIKERWEEEWKKSPRYEKMKRVDPDHPYRKFRKWREDLNRNQGSILVQLRSGHLPINTYLKRIQKRENDLCDWCKDNPGREIPETVNHFILDCPAYDDERDKMVKEIGPPNAQEIKRILVTENGTWGLLNYLDATKRFKDTMGRLNITDYQREMRRKKEEGRAHSDT